MAIQPAVKKFSTTEEVSLEWEVPVSGIFVQVLMKISATPTTAEDITVTVKSRHGTEFDIELPTVDPSNPAQTDVIYNPDTSILVNKGDKILVEYPNTDGATIGVIINGFNSDTF